MSCGSGTTCWRWLKEWHEAGVWHWPHQVLLQRLSDANQLDWSRASVDSSSLPAIRGAKTARIRRIEANRARSAILWSKPRAPLAAVLSAAIVHDSRMMVEAADAIKPIKCCRIGRLRQRPQKLHADKAYDSAPL